MDGANEIIHTEPLPSVGIWESSPMWMLGPFDSERVDKDYLEETMWLEALEYIMYAEDEEIVSFKAWHLLVSFVCGSSSGLFVLGEAMLC